MPKLFDVIKYEGDMSTFVWKHPCEDFNAFTQLIVHENQEAVFYMNGRAMDLFKPGRYTLKSQNLPILSSLLSLASGGISPFHCEVYFINKSEQMAIKWGTDSRVHFVEPTYNFPLSVGACGEMSLSVSDSRNLLIKLVGTEDDLSQAGLTRLFRGLLMTKVKSYIAHIIKSAQLSIFELDENLQYFSDSIKELLCRDFADYGLSLDRFFVTNVLRPEGDAQYEKFKELHFRQYADIAEAKLAQQTELIYAETKAQKTVIDSRAQATKREQEGYTYQQERAFDVAEKVAENEAVGEFANMGVGLGTMVGVGASLGGMVGNMVTDSVQKATEPGAPPASSRRFCEECGAQLSPSAIFCEECGTKASEKNNTCTKCGYKFERPSKFCARCGAKREN